MKKTVAILFGGCSSEYDVSLVSATSVIKNIKKDKYNLLMIGITRDGDFYLYNGDVNNIEKDEWLNEKDAKRITISTNRSDHGIIVLETNEIIQIDVAFPVLHGQNGEDGRLQGLLELAGIKYVGCDMTSSAICMDKYLAHEIVSSNGYLSPISYLFNEKDSYEMIENKICNLHFPLFVKPLKAGSSFGITKIKTISELKEALKDKVVDVKVSNRLKSHPVCLVSDQGVSFEMEKVLNAMPDGQDVKAGRILEINPNHDIFKAIQNVYQNNADKINDYASLLFDQALLIEGLSIEDPVAFSNKICELMIELNK